ncbi:MAG: hypothetical protein KJ884_07510, partial [Gammaproteobacteria bacterium]|nr:hypothetical protein [Gammaproteobacteria bacterium]
MAKFWEFEPTEQYQRRKEERAAPQSQGIGTQPTPSAAYDPIRALRQSRPLGVDAPADEEETTPTGGLPDWAKPIASQMTRRTPEPTAAAPAGLPEWAQSIMDKLRPALQPITNAPKVALGAAGLGADMLTGQVDPIAWTRSLAQRAGVGEGGPFTPGEMLDLTGAGSQMALDRYRGSPTEELVNKVGQFSREQYAAPMFGQMLQNNLGYRLAAPVLGLPEPEKPFDPLSLLPGNVGPLMSPWGSPAQVLRDVATGKSPEESRLSAKEFEQQLPGLLRMAGETTLDPFGLPANIAVGLATKGANLPAWASGLLTAYQVADKFDLAANYASMEPEQLVVAGLMSLGLRVGLPALMRALGGKQAKLQYAPAEMDETLARHLRQETEAYRKAAGLPIEDEITIRSAKDVREGPAIGTLSGLNLGQEAVNETKM